MADTPNVCGYWHFTQITPDDVEPARFGYRCVAANGYFTGQTWTKDDISCFRNDTTYGSRLDIPLGLCDGAGGVNSCWETCNRYKPSGMGFGKLAPAGDRDALHEFMISNEGYSEWSEYQQFRLPFKHQVYNIRAKLSKCCYWDDTESADFTIDLATGDISLLGESVELGTDERFPTTKCIFADDRINQNRPLNPSRNLPCNGALPRGTSKGECPRYTGVDWQHCIEEKMKDGDKITAAQIQELRFYSDEWSDYTEPYTVFRGRYIDPKIYAWFYSDDFERGVYYSTPEDGTAGFAKEVEYPIIGYATVPILDEVELNLDSGDVSTKKIIPSGGTPSVNGPPSYPTLIRSLNESISLRPKIIFPHKDYIHRHWTPDGLKITVLGVAIQASAIYVVNNKTHKVPIQVLQAQAKEAQGTLLTSTERTVLNISIEAYLDNIKTYYYEDYVQVEPEHSSGYFIAEEVPLELDSKQDLYVFVQVGSNWYFKSIEIETKFYHSFILQTDFQCNSWTDAYVWDGVAEGQFFQAKNSPTVSKFIWRMKHQGYTYSAGTGDFGELWRYSYNVIKTATQTKIVDENDWWSISSCGEILVRIDDIDINRVEGWEITSATVSRTDGSGYSTQLEVLYPSSLTELSEYFPANYVVLQPVEGETVTHYRKDGSTRLTIKYRRYEDRRVPYNLDSEEEIADPSGVAYINITANRYTETYTDYNWTVRDIYEYNPIFKGYFADETGRIVGAKTTRLLLQYKNVLCRDFEIKYGWVADYNAYRWTPAVWCCEEPNTGIPFGQQFQYETSHACTPACGDHEVGKFYQVGIGPMFYPYQECDEEINYAVGQVGNVCTLPVDCQQAGYEGDTCGAWNHRLRGPDDKFANIFGDPNPAIFSCRLPYQYGFDEKVTSNNMFAGFASSRGNVDIAEYLAEGWKLPMFGNVLREQAWVNRSIAFDQYFDVNTMTFEWKFMPVLEEYSRVEDIFSEDEIHPFTFLTADYVANETINETFYDTKYDFDEVLWARAVQEDSGAIWYPRAIEGYNLWYQFLDPSLTSGDSTQWLYREKWEDPERPNLKNEDEDASLPCALIYNVDPALDSFHSEYKKNPPEGSYYLRFSPPVFNDGGDITDDAYFQFGIGEKRYFDIENFEWKDSTVMVGGVETDSKYKNWASGGEWDAYPNLWAMSVSEGTTTEADSYGYHYQITDPFLATTDDHYYFPGIQISLRDHKFPFIVSGDLTGIEYSTSFRMSPKANHPTRTIDYGWHSYNGSKLATPGTGSDNNSLAWSTHSEIELIIDIGKPITLAELRVSALIGNYTDTFTLGIDKSIYTGVFPACEVFGSNDEFSGYTSLFTFAEVSYSTVRRAPGKFSEFTVSASTDSVTSFAKRYRYFKLVFPALSEEGSVLFLSYIKFKEMQLVGRVETPINLKDYKFYKTTGNIVGNFNYHGTHGYPTMYPGNDHSTIYLTETRIQGIVGPDAGFKVAHKCRARAGKEYHADSEDRLYWTYAASQLPNTCVLEAQQQLYWTAANESLGHESSYTYNLIPDIVSYLAEYGITFPSVSLLMATFTPEDLGDDLLVPVFGDPPETCDSWSAAGHWYMPSPHLIWTEVCGGIGTGCGAFHSLKVTCDYCFKHENHSGYHGEQDECNLAVNPATIYTNKVAVNALAGQDEWSDILGPDIRMTAARDYVAGEYLRNQ